MLKSIRILSRKSDLAVIQAKLVGQKIKEYFPELSIEYITKKTSGDIDLKTPLSEMQNSGVFTNDLRNHLVANKCDIAVHSWKDLPLDIGPYTVLAGSLKRADQRDILFVKKISIEKIKQQKSITILSSSPRRIYNLNSFIKEYLPFNLNEIHFDNVRGNIISRFKKFLEGSSDGLIIAKAAIDRLLKNNIKDFDEVADLLKVNIKKCLWTITPLSQNPTSPAQGAIGIEVSSNNKKIINIIEKISDKETVDCVHKERKILKQYGGGCHQKIGVSYFVTHFGMMISKKGETDDGNKFYAWEINEFNNNINKKVEESLIYPPSLKDHNLFKREHIFDSIKKINELKNHNILISRASALPMEAKIDATNLVWTSGTKTWKSMADKGIWINGTADGMGENIEPNIENLNSNPWVKLTHKSAPITRIKSVIYTYSLIELPINEDISNKKFFYWMSSSAFKYVLKQHPAIMNGYHACGPGNTYEVIKKFINDPKHLEVVLSYNSWKKKLLGF